jgi:phosphoglycolate phosphatase-like HAD superfamily hydrolase
VSAAPVKVVLFDIDGTLLDAGGVGRAALDAAFRELWDIDGATADIVFAGSTDRELVREALTARLGVNMPAVDERMITSVLASYLQRLPEQLASSTAFRVLPGVESLLNRLAQTPQVVMALATGNLAPAARLKLAKGRLNRFFRTGGFGGDAPTRAGIVAIAIERVARQIGGKPERKNVYLVGDTVRDIKAARAAGVVPVGVATGPDDIETLRKAGASIALKSLAEARALLEHLGLTSTQ